MPIQGLTDRPASFPEIGQLRKGAEKPESGKQPGRDLKGFRFTSTDEAAVTAFYERWGEEPRSIDVVLPFATTEENFETWQEAYTASSLQHRCDGVTATLWLDKSGKYQRTPIDCPGGCKPVGRLKVVIPSFVRLAYVTVLTGSIHDIMEIQSNLQAVEMVRGDLRGIPFVLKRSPREISTPREGGKRARVEKWLISMEVAPSFVTPLLTYVQQAALPQVRALPDGGGLVDTDTGELFDEPEPEYTVEEPVKAAPSNVVPFNAAKARSKIRKMWAEERDLVDQLYTDKKQHDEVMGDQNEEIEKDLDAMKDEELAELGGYIRVRVDALKLALEDITNTEQAA